MSMSALGEPPHHAASSRRSAATPCRRHASFPSGRTHLRNQGLRASDSVVLNLAEGLPNRKKPMGKRHLRVALGSAAEAAVVPCGSQGSPAPKPA